MAVKYSHIYCCILAHCHCKTLQEKLHERSGESHDRFAWITVTILIFAPVRVTYQGTSATAIFDPHTHQYSTACTDTLRTIPSTEGKKTSEVHYSEDYKPETNARGQNTEQQVTDSLPDRMVNPDQYRPLLPVEGELAHQQDSTESGDHEQCIIISSVHIWC